MLIINLKQLVEFLSLSPLSMRIAEKLSSYCKNMGTYTYIHQSPLTVNNINSFFLKKWLINDKP